MIHVYLEPDDFDYFLLLEVEMLNFAMMKVIQNQE